VTNQVVTGDPGTEESVQFSGDRLTAGVGNTGIVSGSPPSDYAAALNGQEGYVDTFRVEDPDAFARTAFIEALQRAGVKVDSASPVANPTNLLPDEIPLGTEVARYTSAPYDQVAKLVLKVGLEQGEHTVKGALAAERRVLTQEFDIDPSLFNFPTNGSGSPDSQAAPRALAQWLAIVRKDEVGATFQQALPILGVDGSLSGTGKKLPGRGRIFAKTGTTVGPGTDGKPHLVAQCLAGYIETQAGRRVAYALMVNNAGPLKQLIDVTEVFEDQAVISNAIFEAL
jgi:D-alanyl-D-alanine carboxypeptidase/D-alanyl-D-alanine-endopeptidase (penicillin-binding protein 4)